MSTPLQSIYALEAERRALYRAYNDAPASNRPAIQARIDGLTRQQQAINDATNVMPSAFREERVAAGKARAA